MVDKTFWHKTNTKNTVKCKTVVQYFFPALAEKFSFTFNFTQF